MKRQVIKIDEEKCTGCGLCASACHEGALAIINGKAKLLRDDFCDGMGDCLPACPANALTFETREAEPFNEALVTEHMKDNPTIQARSTQASKLTNWPIQIKLAPTMSPAFKDAHLLIAADCTGFVYGGLQEDFIKGRKVLIGCSKLDSIDYSEKLTTIFKYNTIRSIRILRMEVPCCGGLERMVHQAILNSGKDIPVSTTIISSEGKIVA